MQLLICERAHFTRFALPDQRGFVFAGGLDMAVEAVVGKIQLSAEEPFRPGVVPVENLVPFLEPVQIFGDATPEFFGLLDGLVIDALVVFEALEMRASAELFGWLELSLLLKDGVNVCSRQRGLVGHAEPLDMNSNDCRILCDGAAAGPMTLCGLRLRTWVSYLVMFLNPNHKDHEVTQRK